MWDKVSCDEAWGCSSCSLGQGRFIKRVVHEETKEVFFEKGDVTIFSDGDGSEVVAYSPRIHNEVIVEANEFEEI